MIVAAVLRVVFALVATYLLGVPGLLLVGSLLLFYVCWGLYKEIRSHGEEEAAEVCYVNYGVSFTMFAPTSVRGEEANPVFSWLAGETKAPRWNFNKYLVSADRKSVRHFGSFTKPSSRKFTAAIEKTLVADQ